MLFLNKNQDASDLRMHTASRPRPLGWKWVLTPTGNSASASAPGDLPQTDAAPAEKVMPTEPGGNSNPHTNSQNDRHSRLSKLAGTN